MERLYKEKLIKRAGAGHKDLPECERCGKPVRLSSDDYARDEILCAACAHEANTRQIEDYEQQ